MNQLLHEAQGMTEALVAMRRTLHQHPELGFELPKTTALVAEELQKLGISSTPCAGGLTAFIGNPSKGRTVLLRADLDALPMQEKSGLPFAACGSACHACGHDIHTTMLLGAAKMLKKRESSLNGAVLLMFQPAEEIAMGAKAMLDEGLLEKNKVDRAFGIHVAPFQPAGRVNLTPGNKTASYDCFTVTFTGKGGHGAQPQNTVDPINAAVHAYTALQALISRECSPAEPAVLTIGSFHAGAAGNIIPDSASFQGTIRAASAEWRGFLRKRLVEICEGTAHTLRAQVGVEWQAQVPPLYNDPELVGQALDWLLQTGIDVNDQVERLSASEDFALVSELVPTVYLNIGSGLPEDGYAYGNHHPAVAYDEAILPVGAASLAACALGTLK